MASMEVGGEWGAVSIVYNNVLENLKEYENDIIILK